MYHRSADDILPVPGLPGKRAGGEGNITIHSQQLQRYWCRGCKKAFSAWVNTPYYRRRTDEETISRVVTLVDYGYPLPVVEAAFGFQAQTVRERMQASGRQAEALHQHLVVQERELVHVQADEIRVKTQAGVVWMAMALMVSTSLWLGGVLSPRRDRDLITRLVVLVAACAQFGPLLFVSDGLSTYVDAVRRAFRTRQTGTGARLRLLPWTEVAIAQVVK